MSVVANMCLGLTHAIVRVCCMYASEYCQREYIERVATHGLLVNYTTAKGGADNIMKSM